jgi:hypothetical protein
MSKIIYKKFLPAIMRNTRWGDLITVFQNIVDDLKTEKINLLKNKFNLDLMTQDELFDTASEFGFDLLSLDGYTSSEYFLRREVSTIVPRIKSKNTRTGYKYIFYNFNLTGDVYPILLSKNVWYPLNDAWLPLDQYWDDTTIIYVQDFTIDPDIPDTLDSSTGLWISTLDQTQLNYVILRVLLISYKPKYIETTSEFISVNTQKVFYNDVLQMKRITEIPYFEHRLEIETNCSGVISTRTYTDYANTISADMKSIMIGNCSSGLLPVNFARIGNSAHTTLNSSITSVASLVGDLRTGSSGTLGMLQYIEDNKINQFYARKELTNKNTFPTFSEISLHNANSGCLYYSSFPKVHWDSKQFANVLFKINLI